MPSEFTWNFFKIKNKNYHPLHEKTLKNDADKSIDSPTTRSDVDKLKDGGWKYLIIFRLEKMTYKFVAKEVLFSRKI